MTIFLCNYDTTANWESMSEERLKESFVDLNDFASPTCLAVLDSEELIPEWLKSVKEELAEWYSEMEQEFGEVRWHCRGWEPVAGRQTKREAIYELIQVESLYDKAFKVPEPIAIAVIKEVNFWSPK